LAFGGSIYLDYFEGSGALLFDLIEERGHLPAGMAMLGVEVNKDGDVAVENLGVELGGRDFFHGRAASKCRGCIVGGFWRGEKRKKGP